MKKPGRRGFKLLEKTERPEWDYISPSFPSENTFQDPQWVPEAADSTKPTYTYYVFSYTYLQ